MWRFNLRERWKARTYTPFSFYPHLAVIALLVNMIWGVNLMGHHTSEPIPDGVRITPDSQQWAFWLLIMPATFAAGLVLAILRRRPRRWRAVGWGWTWKWRWLHKFDDRFHVFPFGPIKRLRLTEAVYGDFNGAACASFSLWPRWRLLRRFYDVDLVELPAVLPALALFPMGQYDRAATAFGGADIETESEAFNRIWRVVARDERYALAVLHTLMIAELLKPAYRNMLITIDGGAILTWHPGRARFTELGARLARLRNLAALIPRHVWDDFGEHRSEAWGPPGTLFRPGWDFVPANPIAAYKQLPRVRTGIGVAGVTFEFGESAGDGVVPPHYFDPAAPDVPHAKTAAEMTPTFYPADNDPHP